MTPDAFLNDWYGYTTNQAGHVFVVGLMGFAACSLLWRLTGGVATSGGWQLMLGSYTVWELHQWLIQGALWWDSLEDWAFVMLGVVLGYAAWNGRRKILAASVAISAIMLAIGTAIRAKRGADK